MKVKILTAVVVFFLASFSCLSYAAETTKNPDKFLNKIKQQAKQGDTIVQNNLDLIYDNGQGVPPYYYTKIVKVFQKAAKQGNAGAQYELGIMYVKGQGVPQNFKEAYFWFNLAAIKGDKQFVKVRNLFADGLTPQALLKVQKRAQKWRPVKASKD